MMKIWALPGVPGRPSAGLAALGWRSTTELREYAHPLSGLTRGGFEGVRISIVKTYEILIPDEEPGIDQTPTAHLLIYGPSQPGGREVIEYEDKSLAEVIAELVEYADRFLAP